MNLLFKFLEAFSNIALLKANYVNSFNECTHNAPHDIRRKSFQKKIVEDIHLAQSKHIKTTFIV
jgi:hypothetical protein